MLKRKQFLFKTNFPVLLFFNDTNGMPNNITIKKDSIGFYIEKVNDVYAKVFLNGKFGEIFRKSIEFIKVE